VLHLLLAASALGGLTSCSIKKMAANSVANTLATGPDVFSTDDDIQLVRESVPFGLKTMESLLEIVPRNENLLTALSRGFTHYSFAFVQLEAEELEPVDYAKAVEQRGRALKLYLRARDYGLRGLELRHKGIAAQLARAPDSAAALLGKKDVPLLFWTAAAWGFAISIGKDRPELLADLGAVQALMRRGLQLDETYEGGAFHEARIVLEALPAAMGGSVDRAREHFRRAVELSKGMRAGPYVTLAQSVSVMTQNRKEFEDLLNQALAVDPNATPNLRLANLVIQRRARTLLARGNELFIEDAP
jgi:predicted anti-sigma-YlaC factor YlaD